jgi:hypothetical protein
MNSAYNMASNGIFCDWNQGMQIEELFPQHESEMLWYYVSNDWNPGKSQWRLISRNEYFQRYGKNYHSKYSAYTLQELRDIYYLYVPKERQDNDKLLEELTKWCAVSFGNMIVRTMENNQK